MPLAWEAYRAGSLPVGAVVVDSSSEPVGQARSTRHEDIQVPNQLANTRIAHAEVNALAQLPCKGSFQGMSRRRPRGTGCGTADLLRQTDTRRVAPEPPDRASTSICCWCEADPVSDWRRGR